MSSDYIKIRFSGEYGCWRGRRDFDFSIYVPEGYDNYEKNEFIKSTYDKIKLEKQIPIVAYKREWRSINQFQGARWRKICRIHAISVEYRGRTMPRRWMLP